MHPSLLPPAIETTTPPADNPFGVTQPVEPPLEQLPIEAATPDSQQPDSDAWSADYGSQDADTNVVIETMNPMQKKVAADSAPPAQEDATHLTTPPAEATIETTESLPVDATDYSSAEHVMASAGLPPAEQAPADATPPAETQEVQADAMPEDGAASWSAGNVPTEAGPSVTTPPAQESVVQAADQVQADDGSDYSAGGGGDYSAGGGGDYSSGGGGDYSAGSDDSAGAGGADDFAWMDDEAHPSDYKRKLQQAKTTRTSTTTTRTSTTTAAKAALITKAATATVSKAAPAKKPITVSDFTASTGFNYILNTQPMQYQEAQNWCKTNGGHLATYVSLDEQVEVETYYVTYGGCPLACVPAGQVVSWRLLRLYTLTTNITQSQAHMGMQVNATCPGATDS